MNKLFLAMKTFGKRYIPTRILLHLIALMTGIIFGSFFTLPIIYEYAKPDYPYVSWIPIFLSVLVVFRAFYQLNKWNPEKTFESESK